ncbi:MAG: hypothetical protein KAI06_07800 [Anaerolineales bacterium]|nr:hypothetical protein [Anaerolineales bacterium]
MTDDQYGSFGNGENNHADERRWLPRQVISGEDERIFSVLPESVLTNFLNPTSENALLWNVIYLLAQPTISLKGLLSIKPLWGNPNEEDKTDDALTPYYWGYDVDGVHLSKLDDVLLMIEGSGPKTEVDLYFLGERNLILVESKRKSGFGRCSRFTRRRCPEMHLSLGHDRSPCRYWEVEESRFTNHLTMDPHPNPNSETPACNRHYQLARTLIIGHELADLLGREFHLWVFTPRLHWSKLEKDWLDFMERVQDDPLWRRLRVIAWEDVQGMATR